MEDNLKFCQACLSGDRVLVPLKNISTLLQTISFSELLSVQGGLCWECNHAIRKFLIFRRKVQRVQEILRDHNVKIKKLSPLTSLAVKIVSDIQYNFSYDHVAGPETSHQMNIKEANLENNQEFIVKEELDIDLEPNSPSKEEYYNEDIVQDTLDIKKCSEIYVEVFNEKTIQNTKVTRKFEKEEFLKDDAKDKFETIVYAEGELLKIRQEKRDHPNFKKIPYKCDSCVLGFTRKENYDVHLEKKHKKIIGPYECPVCLVRFKFLKQVARHKEKHYTCYRCKLCKYETAEMWTVVNHVRTKHVEDNVENIHCSYCVFIAKSPEELSSHASREHAVYCHDCGARFKALTTLKSHIRRIHRVKREFICSICSKPFKTKSRLETHIVTHNSALAQKLAYCAPCNTQYKNIYVYRNHLKTSANHAEQSYECVECNKRFASKVYWKKHYNFYHLHKSQFKCDVCNKLFISDWRLKSHRQTQHGLSRSRDHPCPVCGKQFFTLSTLRGHQLTHSEQRSFMCEDCGDTFKQRPALYTHARLVHRGFRRKKIASATNTATVH